MQKPCHAISHQVIYNLIGCLSYITNIGDLEDCCHGVRALHREAFNQGHRQTACRCMQFAARAIPGIDWDRANNLPNICDVDVQQEINPSTNFSIGVKSLNLAAITILDRQTTCNCLKVEANNIVGFNWLKAAALPTEWFSNKDDE
ncbi:hypothetical protein H5410_044661 [Solanum commersonii]|uniref:Bifunctional inhibitor/plant lipid transfer protein/seed storage helical domain-containing protein n=1 Tax=Solanum commersonii TaxID=4109 RepID=A0A9J5X7L8_SOLCO|nr:hypothetical protein H5410_044661 [Solanum commersonii]